MRIASGTNDSRGIQTIKGIRVSDCRLTIHNDSADGWDMNRHGTPGTAKAFGEYLRRARVAKGKRNRAAWARELGLPNDRVLYDLETGARDNYRDDTLMGVDLWYGLPDGTATAAIRDGVLPTDSGGSDGDSAAKTLPVAGVDPATGNLILMAEAHGEDFTASASAMLADGIDPDELADQLERLAQDALRVSIVMRQAARDAHQAIVEGHPDPSVGGTE